MKSSLHVALGVAAGLSVLLITQSEKTILVPEQPELQPAEQVVQHAAKSETAVPFKVPLAPAAQGDELTGMPVQEEFDMFAPAVGVTKTAALVTDGGTTGATPGDVLEYTVVVSNTGSNNGTSVTFTDVLDANTTLVSNTLNASPMGVNDSYSCIGNVGIDVPVGNGLLTNDIDPDGNPITITSINTTGTEGQVTHNANGSFTFKPNPGYEGSTTFKYTVSDGKATDEGTVTITVSDVIWFVDNNAGANGDGRLGTPFNSIANFNTGASDEAGDFIFLYRNTTNNYTGSITLLNDQALIGAGATASVVAITGITVPSFSYALPATGGTNPVINNSGSVTTLQLASRNKLHGFNITNAGGIGISGNLSSTLLTVRDVAVSNTSGTALSLAAGQLDAVFNNVSASNATSANYGIAINNTTGSIEIKAGTISNIEQRGASFTSVTNVKLTNLTFTNANTANGSACDFSTTGSCNGAIYMNGVSNVTMTNVDVSGTVQQGFNGIGVSGLVMTDCDYNNCGDGQYEGCVKLRNLSGTSSITNCTFANAAEELVEIINDASAAALTLNVSGSTFGDTFDKTFGAKGIFVTTANTATNNVTISNSTFRRIKTQGVNLRASAGTMNANVIDCSFTKDTKRFMSGIEIIPQGSAVMNINVNRNTLNTAGGSSILVQGAGTATYQARISNNIITGPATCGDCVADNNGSPPETATCNCYGDGITVWSTANSNGKAVVSANNITGIDYTGRGIYANARNAATLNIDINGNTVGVSNDAWYNIDVVGGDGSTGTAVICAYVRNNTVSGTPGFVNFRARATGSGNSVQLQGTGTSSATIWNNNSNTPASPTATTANSTGSGGTITYGSTCSVSLTHPTAEAYGPVVNPDDKPVIVQVGNNQTQQDSASVEQQAEQPQTPVVLAGETVSIAGFTLPAGESTTIKFRATINNTIPAGVCQISNQATVSGSNFADVLSDDPAVTGAANPTLTSLATMSLGNLVYLDNNKNGVFDAGDAGKNGVAVQLYRDNGSTAGTLDAGDALATSTTTAAGGLYNFTGLCAGDYLVVIPAANFGTGAALEGYESSPAGTAPDPDNDVDNDDNGQPGIGGSIASQAITLQFNGALVESNTTVDFGFKLICPVFTGAPANVTITNSSCDGSCTISGGVITAPSGTPCPDGSILQYQVNGGAWTTTLPVYAQTGPAQTIKTRCSCEADPSKVSAESSAVVTVPGTVCNTVSLSSAIGSNNQSVCQFAPIVPITYATSCATGASFSGLPSGVSGNWSAGVATISGIPTAAGTFNYTVTLTGGIGSVSATGSITVNASALGTSAFTTTLNLSGAGYFNNASNCQAGGVVQPNGAAPVNGNVTFKVWVEPSQPNYNGRPFLMRHYEITPANNASTATARITLYAKQSEFDAFNNFSTTDVDLPFDAADPEGNKKNVRIYKYVGSSSDGTGLPGTYASAGRMEIDPDDNDIVWNATANRWEISFDVTGFSGFFIGNSGTTILPVTWVNVSASVNAAKKASIQWKVSEQEVAYYQVERSSNGQSFTAVGPKLPSQGNGMHQYNLVDHSGLQDVAYYRVAQVDKNGQLSYSSVVKLYAANGASISVYPNPARESISLSISSNLLGSRAVLSDVNGRRIMEVPLTSTLVTINLSKYSAGVYLLTTSKGQSFRIVKE